MLNAFLDKGRESLDVNTKFKAQEKFVSS